MKLEELLCDWLPKQRWFAGKGQGIDDLAIETDIELMGGDPALRHLVVAVDQGDVQDRYQVLLGVRGTLPHRLEHALIGWCNFGAAYDAAHDADLTRVLLENIAAGKDVGPIEFRPMRGMRLNTDLTSLVIGAEQSNTSWVYGEEYICKLFRRLAPGPNPDLEITVALTRTGSAHAAPACGWIQMPLDGVATTLAMLQVYLRTASDGWSLAATSVRDLYAEADLHAHEVGGDFAAESERLGAATAEVHRDLATTFPTEKISPAGLAELAEGMHQRLEAVCKAVPELADYADPLGAAFDAVAGLDEWIAVQRVHGDYHLGQVVRTEHGWVLLDFEGEPARPLDERRALASPLRDVAGMLRSYEYAARHLLDGHPREPQLEHRAREWADRNRDAFCAGYAGVGTLDPRAHGVLLRAFEYDKAVYEVMYEARHRPSWLRIPLDSIASRLGGA
ncbi:MAG: aminoglycoside phosphotransferase [Streptosporangiales bacterium]|nr:aminoglycoside phosphotransferase [Streptosporangiales bacterium]